MATSVSSSNVARFLADLSRLAEDFDFDLDRNVDSAALLGCLSESISDEQKQIVIRIRDGDAVISDLHADQKLFAVFHRLRCEQVPLQAALLAQQKDHEDPALALEEALDLLET